MTRIAIDAATDILGIIDVQPTFMPGGELAVADGDAVVAPINRLLAGPFRHAFATQDWHAPGHISFASSHPGRAPYDTIDVPYGRQTLWPDHGIQESANAALHPDLAQARIDVIVRKGTFQHIDSYSAFFENDRKTPTGLDGWLRARGFKRIFMCGLAADFCVAWSAEDAASLGYETYMVEDASRGVAMPGPGNRTTMELSREHLIDRGVRFVTSADLG
jgi:nicotinamidase/pyrazinamidase